MSLNPFSALEKLINEHGSANILRERLAFAADQFGVLEKENINLQKSLSDAMAKIDSLESRNADLEKQLAKQTPDEEPGDKCPYCRKPTGKLIKLAPHPQHLMKAMGIQVAHYKCANEQCNRDYEKQIKP